MKITINNNTVNLLSKAKQSKAKQSHNCILNNNYFKFYTVLFLARFNNLYFEFKNILNLFLANYFFKFINKFFSFSLHNKKFYFRHKEILKSYKFFCIMDFIL